MFQALFSRQKVSNISFKIEFSLQLSYQPVYTKVEKQCAQNKKNAYVCKHTHFFGLFILLYLLDRLISLVDQEETSSIQDWNRNRQLSHDL